MQCPRCRAENTLGRRFCSACGQPLPRECANCGYVNAAGDRFCGGCGRPQPPAAPLDHPAPPYTPAHLAERVLGYRGALEGERKQVTVLFADVVNFSALAERLDPEAVHAMMNGCFELLTAIVHRYEGTINQFTGDGIMALFGAPVTLEDHAILALEAALSIRDEMAVYGGTVERQWDVPFRMRVGLNSGRVVVGRIGDNMRMDYTALGDTTNLAARLQQMAPPGAIWTGETTYRLAVDAFEWRQLGAVSVKGRGFPVEAYELVDRAEPRSRFRVQIRRGLTRFVGRSQELEQLLGLWDKARRGRGQVVSVVGEAGLGKSRLLHELKTRLVRLGARCLEGSCFAYGESIAYLPFLAVVRELFGLEAVEERAELARRIDEGLTRLGVDLKIAAPSLHKLLGCVADELMFDRLPAYLVRQRTVDALTTTILAAAAREPLVLILEDVHWIDKATEAVLTTLVDGMGDVPLLLVLACRPEYLSAWADRTHHARIALSRLPGETTAELVRAILSNPRVARVPLDPLPPDQIRAMVRELLGDVTIAPTLEQLVVRKTDGNPFFVEELIRSLLESGALVRKAGAYTLAVPVETLELPTTLEGVLLSRIDRLDGDLKLVLQITSVIGRVFSHALVSQAMDQGPDLPAALQQLEDLDFVYPIDAGEFSFKHALTQEAVYRALLRPQREAFHERIGRAMEALARDRVEEQYELLAYHYTRSRDADKASEYLYRANQKAIKANAMTEAKAYFDEAMTLLDSRPMTELTMRQRITLLVHQVEVFLLLARWQEYHDLLTRHEAMAIQLGDSGLLGALYGRLGACAWAFGAFDRAIEAETRAISLCEAASASDDAAQAYLTLQWSYLHTGEYDRVFSLHERIVRKAEQRLSIRRYVRAFGATAWASLCLGAWARAIEHAQEVVRVGEEYTDASVMSYGHMLLAMIYSSQGDPRLGTRHGQRAVDRAPTPSDRVWAQSVLGWSLSRAGEPRQGIEILAGVAPLYQGSRFASGEVANAAYLGEAHLLAGELEAAAQTLGEGLARAEECRMRFYAGWMHRLLAEIALSQQAGERRPDQAAPHLEQSVALLRAIGADNELALAYALRGRLLHQQGALTEAHESLTDALRIVERLGTLGEPDRIRGALAGLDVGRAEPPDV